MFTGYWYAAPAPFRSVLLSFCDPQRGDLPPILSHPYITPVAANRTYARLPRRTNTRLSCHNPYVYCNHSSVNYPTYYTSNKRQ